jgi:HlyD family secretion protein
LFVKEGDRVTVGEVLAVLENKERLEAAWNLAEVQVEVAKSRIAQAKAGLASDLAAQQAEVERLEAELDMAKADYKRRLDIRESGAVSVADLDHARVDVETDGKLIDTAKSKLQSLVDVQGTDVDLAGSQYEAAVADAKRAKAEMGQAILRSPIDGVVIKIHAHAGELAGSEGVMELAKTDSMFVIAEVYETDIGRVKTGQQASVTSEVLPQPLTGVVRQIGFKVGTRDIVSDDPSVANSTRVVEVKVALNESALAANLIGARVTVHLMP